MGQWANLHNALAQSWVTGDPSHVAYVDDWAKAHPDLVANWVKENPGTPEPKAADLAVLFFENFSKENPGKFPATINQTGSDGKTVTTIGPINEGSDIQSTFCLMWREEYPDADLEDVPGDLVTASASGLDPHVTRQNAEYQLDRVASKWAENLKRNPTEIRGEIERILAQNSSAPWGGLAGEEFINVLEVNLELCKKYGNP